MIHVQRGHREADFADLCRKHPVMILSAGKGGTSALYGALLAQYAGLTIRLENLPPADYENFRHTHFGWHYVRDYCDYLLMRYVHSPPPAGMDADNSRLKIIMPIREPIGYHVASFYEAGLQSMLGIRKRTGLRSVLRSWLPSALKLYIKHLLAKLSRDSRLKQRLTPMIGTWAYQDTHIEQIQNLDPPQLRQMFLQRYDAQFFAIDWFDNCVKKYLSLDVYEQPFPDEKVAYYSISQADMMIMESSLPNATKAQRVQDFLGLDAFEMGYRKVTAEKTRAIADSYALFKNEVKLPGWYLDKMLGSKFFRHFYTKEDEERLRQQWSE